jgi:hypothetical protein
MMRLWSPASISSSEPPLYCIFSDKGTSHQYFSSQQWHG